MKSLLAAVCCIALLVGLNDASAAGRKSKKVKKRQTHSKSVKKAKAAKTQKTKAKITESHSEED